MEEIVKQCIDCGKDFTWSTDEQKYYKKQGLLPPKRCRECRVLRRKTLDEARTKEANGTK